MLYVVLFITIILILVFVHLHKPKILFLMSNPPTVPEYNGDLVRTGGVPISGTHQSSILICEGLAQRGYDVTIYDSHVRTGLSRNVRYINSKDDIDYDKTDIILAVACVSYDQQTFDKKFKNVKKLILIFNTVEYNKNVEEIYSHIDAKERDYVFVSKSTKDGNRSDKGHIIYNPVMGDMLTECNENRPENSFVWNASWDRGGDVAVKVSERCNGTFSKMTYSDKKVGFDKKGVIETLNKNKYFVYPLVRPSGEIHKDCCPCSVIEALCMGVHVITWPAPCMKELFGEGKGCHIVNLPDNFNREKFENFNLEYEPNLLSDQAVSVLADVVKSIGDEPVDYKYWRNKFSLENVVDEFEKIFTN